MDKAKASRDVAAKGSGAPPPAAGGLGTKTG